jgi:large subunit ribosomal protein L19
MALDKIKRNYENEASRFIVRGIIPSGVCFIIEIVNI